MKLVKRVGLLIMVAVSMAALSGGRLQQAALAIPSLQTAFLQQYPFLRGTQLDSCATCHMPVEADYLNRYGIALRDAELDFARIESEDADGDGKTNIEELKQESLPGSRAVAVEYFIFHPRFAGDQPDVGAVHFNHEMHAVKATYLSGGRCDNCHRPDGFPRKFDDAVPIRPMAHRICWGCHETSGSPRAPCDCTSCHTGVKDMRKALEADSDAESKTATPAG